MAKIVLVGSSIFQQWRGCKRIYLGYTKAALYFGFYGYDAHPDSLVGRSRNFDAELWYEDIVELFIDPGFTRRNYIHVGINHLGTVHDAWLARGLGQRRCCDLPQAR